VSNGGKLNCTAPKNDYNIYKFAIAPKNLMMGNRGLVTVGMNFCGVGLQFVAPTNDNTFNDPISCFPC